MRILVIGAGVIGRSTAYYARAEGHTVTLVERGAENHDGCSFGNAGLVVPSHLIPLAAPGMVSLGLKWMWNSESPFYVKPRLNLDLLDWGWKFWCASNASHVARSAPLLRDLSLASRACFEELALLPGNDFGLVKKGLLVLCKTAHALEEEGKAAELARSLGVPAEVLTSARAAAMDPGVRMDICGAVYFPKDCHLSPSRFMGGMKAQLERSGVTMLWDTEVRGWQVAGRRVEAVRTTRGDLEADEVVVCGGSWSAEVAKGLRLQLPLQAGKGYSLTLPKPTQLPQIPAILCEARVAVTPMGSSLRFGGTMEIAGLNEEINPARVRGIIKSVPRYYPDFKHEDFNQVPAWRGLRPCSPDGLPYVGRVSRYDNVSVATGHAMLGLSLGPVTGKLMASVLSGRPPEIDLTLLSPDRYA